MVPRNHVDNYKPITSDSNPHTSRDALKEMGINENSLMGEPSRKLIKLREFFLVQQAAMYAWAVIEMIIDFYPKNEQPFIISEAEKLEAAIKKMDEMIPQIVIDMVRFDTRRIEPLLEELRTAVQHMGGIFNQSPLRIPEDIQKLALQARDLCDRTLSARYYG